MIDQNRADSGPRQIPQNMSIANLNHPKAIKAPGIKITVRFSRSLGKYLTYFNACSYIYLQTNTAGTNVDRSQELKNFRGKQEVKMRKRTRRPALDDVPGPIRKKYKKIFIATVLVHMGGLEDPWTQAKIAMIHMFQLIWDDIFPENL